METYTVYLALGSNLGDRRENLRQAVAALTPQVDVRTKSHIYETDPWGFEDQPKFLNMAVKGLTYLEPEPLLRHLKRLEVALGRQATFPNGPRTIDIDILFFGDRILNTPELTLPHPRLHERGFVLLPLMDLAPDLVHPLFNKSIRDLAASCNLDGVLQVK
jgi:2-amino-4-hydroxy-6-hydroxymethyldihydropteridine diphosphokinase